MLAVVSARLPTGDAPVCGVPLVPYVLVRRGDATGAVAGDEVPEEGSPAAGDARFSLRFRWYRSVMHRGAALCWVHPDREAKLQVREERRRKGGGWGCHAVAGARASERASEKRAAPGACARAPLPHRFFSGRARAFRGHTHPAAGPSPSR